MYQIATEIPNGHYMYKIAVCNIFQMAQEYTNLFHAKGLPKLGFLV
jgi:hypothetical protein